MNDSKEVFSWEKWNENTVEKMIKEALQKDKEKDIIWVYFILCNDEFLKIGKSKNVKNRLNGITTDNPYSLILLGKVNEAIISEVQTQKVFKQYHHKREWYKYDHIVQDIIDDILEYVSFMIYYQEYESFMEAIEGFGQSPLGIWEELEQFRYKFNQEHMKYSAKLGLEL